MNLSQSRSVFSRLISSCLIVSLIVSVMITPRSYADVEGLPQPGTMVNLSPAYMPLMITGLKIHPENPLLLDFIVNTGNTGFNASRVKTESNRLIKYFLASLTIPENNQWVNLSPYEKQRIIPNDLGQTVLGQDMLAQDYILKQLTASLIYPEKNLGKDFWNKVYAKAAAEYGTTQIPVNTFNKVWILPQYAKVYEHKGTVFVVKSHLKVMLDEDYLSVTKHAQKGASLFFGQKDRKKEAGTFLASQIIRQIILPAIEEEVNTGKNFAQMRQIYNSMILAVWFKQNLKQTLLSQVYVDQSKVNGVNTNDPTIKEKIYRQYLEAYKKGVFNYIKEETDQATQQSIPRKYFSGGLTPVDAAMIGQATADEAMSAFGNMPGNNFMVRGQTKDTAMMNHQQVILEMAALYESIKWRTLQSFAALSNKRIFLSETTKRVDTSGRVVKERTYLYPHGKEQMFWVFPGSADEIPVPSHEEDQAMTGKPDRLLRADRAMMVFQMVNYLFNHRNDFSSGALDPTNQLRTHFDYEYGYVEGDAAVKDYLQQLASLDWNFFKDQHAIATLSSNGAILINVATGRPMLLSDLKGPAQALHVYYDKPNALVYLVYIPQGWQSRDEGGLGQPVVPAQPGPRRTDSPANTFPRFVEASTRALEASEAPVGVGDRAMRGENGGIDLNAKHLNMESTGDKVNMIFDRAIIAQFKRGDFSGVTIQIIDVIPVNLMQLAQL